MENWLDVFLRNYRSVPGFRALIKFSLYFIFIVVLIILANIGARQEENNNFSNDKEIEVTEEVGQVLYKQKIENYYLNDHKIIIQLEDNKNPSKLTIEYVDMKVSGLLETNNLTKKFIVKNDEVYETNLNNQTINKELLKDYDLDFVIPVKLVTILQENIGTKKKEDGNIVYTYNIIKDNIKQTIKTICDDKNIKSVLIEKNNKKYIITIE